MERRDHVFAPLPGPYKTKRFEGWIKGRLSFGKTEREGFYKQYMIPYDPKTLEFARQNRRQRNSTRQEGVLWHCSLKKEKIRFFRQYRVGSYILDFYCPKKKLAIELDGGQHYDNDAILYDQQRTAFLNENGITVLRFTNDDVDKNLKEVVAAIKRAIGEN